LNISNSFILLKIPFAIQEEQRARGKGFPLSLSLLLTSFSFVHCLTLDSPFFPIFLTWGTSPSSHDLEKVRYASAGIGSEIVWLKFSSYWNKYLSKTMSYNVPNKLISILVMSFVIDFLVNILKRRQDSFKLIGHVIVSLRRQSSFPIDWFVKFVDNSSL
jgi:hypothetical protein